MYYPQKYKSLEEALDGRHTWRTQGSKVVFTNGCFDLLHAGHVTYLSQAKALGDKLVLGLNSDKSIRTIKGDSRPLVSLDNRVILLDALSMIDMIVSFDEATPVALIQALKPDIHVKGGDYKIDEIIYDLTKIFQRDDVKFEILPQQNTFLDFYRTNRHDNIIRVSHVR